MSMIQVENLTKSFNGKEVVKDISFQLKPGKCVALIGPNGAGKTTTLRMLAGFSKPTNGKILFDQQALSNDIRNYIGYLPQFPVFHPWMSGNEFLIYVGQLGNLSKQEATKRADYLLDRVGLVDAKDRRIGKYSGGMKQRLGIAQAMITQPKLIMLDEPVSALDPIGRREVLDLMEELKQESTILFSTHILSDAEEISDELLLLNKGEILEAGSLQEVGEKYQTAKIEMKFAELPKDITSIIQNLPTVDKVKLEGKSVTIFAENVENIRANLLELAANHQWNLLKFEVGRTTLEDLFMKVVNQ